MEAIEAIRELLGAGGDASLMVLAVVWWRIERRVTRIEWALWPERVNGG